LKRDIKLLRNKPDALRNKPEGLRELAAAKPLHGGDSIAVLLVKALAANQSAGLLVEQSEAVSAIAFRAGVMLSVE